MFPRLALGEFGLVAGIFFLLGIIASSYASADSALAALTTVAAGAGAFAAVATVAGAFLAAGWREAALRLAGDAPLPSGSPVWLTYGLAQALRYNRGHAQALAFLAQI